MTSPAHYEQSHIPLFKAVFYIQVLAQASG